MKDRTGTRIGIIRLEDAWFDAESKIRKLQNFLEDPLESPAFSSSDFMEFYSIIQTLCTQLPPHNYSHRLYDKYRENFQEYSVTMVLPSIEGKHDEHMLRELVRKWLNYCAMMRRMSRIFHYLDRFFVARMSLPTLENVGLACFRDLVFKEVKGNARDTVISLIGKDREGEQIDRALLKNVLEIFVTIGMGSMELYEQDFEAQMLQDSGVYYSCKASNWIVDDSCPAYMLKAEECLERERDRVYHYLHSSSEQKLLEIVQHELLVVYAKQLLEEDSGCPALLRDDRMEDLSRMYRLYHRIPTALDIYSTIFKRYVTAEGTALVEQAEDVESSQAANRSWVAEVLIRKIFELRDKYMAFVCSLDSTLFLIALKEAFEIFCNKTVAGSSIAELLAMFCDIILKKGSSEKLSDKALEETLEKVVKLLSHIFDRDLFAQFYQKKLSSRLLFNQSVNEDHEKSMITKLKDQYGAHFTFKMEAMVTDFTLALENKTKFEEYLRNNTNVNLGIDLTVTVLNARSWPSLKPFDLCLPPEMLRCVEVFEEFYETITKNRKLTWNHSLGICKLIGNFDSQPIELILSTYQAAILLLFNDSDRLSYSEIVTQLNFNHGDANRLLHSLSCAEYKILTKEPNSSTVSATDNFKFNSKFTGSRSIKIPLPLPPVRERRRVIEDVDTDRKFSIDAAIVRIMKRENVMGYTELVMECVKQLAHMFKPDTKAIKKRIDDLIFREYLVRDQEEQDMIKYLPG